MSISYPHFKGHLLTIMSCGIARVSISLFSRMAVRGFVYVLCCDVTSWPLCCLDCCFRPRNPWPTFPWQYWGLPPPNSSNRSSCELFAFPHVFWYTVLTAITVLTPPVVLIVSPYPSHQSTVVELANRHGIVVGSPVYVFAIARLFYPRHTGGAVPLRVVVNTGITVVTVVFNSFHLPVTHWPQ